MLHSHGTARRSVAPISTPALGRRAAPRGAPGHHVASWARAQPAAAARRRGHVATVAGAAPAGPEGAAAARRREAQRQQARQALLDLTAGLQGGFAGSRASHARVRHLVAELQALSPQPSPNARLDLLAGTWRLLYSDSAWLTALASAPLAPVDAALAWLRLPWRLRPPADRVPMGLLSFFTQQGGTVQVTRVHQVLLPPPEATFANIVGFREADGSAHEIAIRARYAPLGRARLRAAFCQTEVRALPAAASDAGAAALAADEAAAAAAAATAASAAAAAAGSDDAPVSPLHDTVAPRAPRGPCVELAPAQVASFTTLYLDDELRVAAAALPWEELAGNLRDRLRPAGGGAPPPWNAAVGAGVDGLTRGVRALLRLGGRSDRQTLYVLQRDDGHPSAAFAPLGAPEAVRQGIPNRAALGAWRQPRPPGPPGPPR